MHFGGVGVLGEHEFASFQGNIIAGCPGAAAGILAGKEIVGRQRIRAGELSVTAVSQHLVHFKGIVGGEFHVDVNLFRADGNGLGLIAAELPFADNIDGFRCFVASCEDSQAGCQKNN